MVIFIANTIKIIKELVVFMGYKVSKLKVFRVAVAVAITKKVRKSIKVIRQQ